jgi:predicted ATPase
LPFIERIDVERFADKSLLIKLQEIFFKYHYVPASFISDGTINVIALILALFFDKHSITIIEEPERNIHPQLISRVIEAMQEASRSKQIFATTHNPEIVRHAGDENLLLISRNKEGFSTISKPSTKEEIKTFMANNIGIHDLFVQGLLK